MPDVFIPEDTALYTSYYREAAYRGLLLQYAFDFNDQNRAQLSKLKTVGEMEQWLKRQNLLERFAQYAEKKGLQRRNLMLQRSAPLFERTLIANIIYDATDQEHRLQYLCKQDPAIIRALQIMEEGKSVPTVEKE